MRLMDALWKELLAAIGVALSGILVTQWTLRTRRIAEWRRKRQAIAASREAMFQTWPTVQKSLDDLGAQFKDAGVERGRITREFAALNERLDKQDVALAQIKAMQWGQMALDPQMRFVCTSDGRNELVNSAYAKELRVGEDELLGYGYKNRIAPEDEGPYIAKWERAAREHRPFEDTVTFIRGDGSRFVGHVRLEPYPRDIRIGPATHWFGVVTKVKEAA